MPPPALQQKGRLHPKPVGCTKNLGSMVLGVERRTVWLTLAASLVVAAGAIWAIPIWLWLRGVIFGPLLVGAGSLFLSLLTGRPFAALRVPQPEMASTPPPNPVEEPAKPPRDVLRARITDMRDRGYRLIQYDPDRLLRESGPWQDAVFDLLCDALTDSMEAEYFRQPGRPPPGYPAIAGLGNRITEQTIVLNNLLTRFDNISIKESWSP